MRELPDGAERLLAVWASSRLSMPTRIALSLVLEGMPYREAASVTGCGDYGDLYWTAKRYGLTELHRERSLYGRGKHWDATEDNSRAPTEHLT